MMRGQEHPLVPDNLAIPGHSLPKISCQAARKHVAAEAQVHISDGIKKGLPERMAASKTLARVGTV
jgi:hypothetical protein